MRYAINYCPDVSNHAGLQVVRGDSDNLLTMQYTATFAFWTQFYTKFTLHSILLYITLPGICLI